MNKKRFFGMALAVLLTGTLSMGLLAGCGDETGGTPDSDTPPQGELNPPSVNNGDGDSVATDPIEGVWSGATLEDGLFWGSGSDTFTATVDLFEDAVHDGYVVVEATESDGDETLTVYIALGVDKEGDVYKGTFIVDDIDDPYSFTATLQDGKLTATVQYSTWSGKKTATLTFTTKTDFPEAITPTGTYYLDNMFLPYGFDFANKKVIVDGVSLPANIYHIGKYISVMATTTEGNTVADIGFTVLQEGSKYRAYSVLAAYPYGRYELDDCIDLVETTPAFHATITFSIDDKGNVGGAAPQDVTLHALDEKFTLPAAPAAKTGYRFAGWKESVYDDEPIGMAGEQVGLSAFYYQMPEIELIACYDAIKYEVAFDKGDITLSGEEQNAAWQKVLDMIPQNVISVDESMDFVSLPMDIRIGNYWLTGWKFQGTDTVFGETGDTGTQAFLTEEIVEALHLTEDSTVTLVAQWTDTTSLN